jgi:hypothetical protein
MQLGNHIHYLKSVGECEGMNPHTPKWVATLGIKVPMDSQIWKVKTRWIEKFIIPWKCFNT